MWRSCGRQRMRCRHGLWFTPCGRSKRRKVRHRRSRHLRTVAREKLTTEQAVFVSDCCECWHSLPSSRAAASPSASAFPPAADEARTTRLGRRNHIRAAGVKNPASRRDVSPGRMAASSMANFTLLLRPQRRKQAHGATHPLSAATFSTSRTLTARSRSDDRQYGGSSRDTDGSISNGRTR